MELAHGTAAPPAPGKKPQNRLFLAAFALSLGLHVAVGAAFLYRTPSPGVAGGTPEAISVSLVPGAVLDAAEEKAMVQQEAAASAPVEGAETGEWREKADATEKPQQEARTEPPPDARPEDAKPEPEASPVPPVLTSHEEKPEDAVPEPAKTKAQPKPAKEPGDAKPHSKKQTPPRQRQAASAGRGASAESGRVSASLGSLTDYAALIRARFARHKPAGIEATGTAKVAFAISPGGNLVYARLAQSSGSAALDAAVLRAVRAAAPFPPPPGGRTFATVIPFDSR